jgi:hypothetical protein
LTRLLGRSGSALLDLTLNCPRLKVPSARMSPTGAITSLIILHAYRLKHLSLLWGGEDILGHGCFPALRSIKFTWLSRLDSPALRIDLLAPILTTASLRRFGRIDTTSLLLYLPWGQLHYLELQGYPLSVLLDLLLRCDILKTIKLSECINDIYERTLPSQSNTLRSLVFVELPMLTVMRPFLHYTTLPHLQSFHIVFGDSEPWPLDAFSSFLARSNCTLTELILIHFPLSVMDLIGIMMSLPSLTHLELVEVPEEHSDVDDDGPEVEHDPTIACVTDDFIDRMSRLHPEDGKFVLLSHLQSLSLTAKCRPDEFLLSKFLKMIRLRSRQRVYDGAIVQGDGPVSCNLNEVYLEMWCQSITLLYEKAVEELECSGLKITVVSTR